jgi:hypothetical protein
MRRRLLPSLLSHRFFRNSSLLRLSAPSLERNDDVTFGGAMVKSVLERSFFILQLQPAFDLGCQNPDSQPPDIVCAPAILYQLLR